MGISIVWGIGTDEPTRLAGKSTLLRILAGKRLTKSRDCRILGQDVFMNPPSVSDDEVTRRRGDEVTRTLQLTPTSSRAWSTSARNGLPTRSSAPISSCPTFSTV